jgi:hypothetical protein
MENKCEHGVPLSDVCFRCFDTQECINPPTNADPINNLAHYTHGEIECIDAIASALGKDGFIAFLRGQVIKYQWRLGHKDSAAQDAAKACWYADKLAEVVR